VKLEDLHQLVTEIHRMQADNPAWAVNPDVVLILIDKLEAAHRTLTVMEQFACQAKPEAVAFLGVDQYVRGQRDTARVYADSLRKALEEGVRV
jgi:hypothetical protein